MRKKIKKEFITLYSSRRTTVKIFEDGNVELNRKDGEVSIDFSFHRTELETFFDRLYNIPEQRKLGLSFPEIVVGYYFPISFTELCIIIDTFKVLPVGCEGDC